jgi:hypothetical protein
MAKKKSMVKKKKTRPAAKRPVKKIKPKASPKKPAAKATRKRPSWLDASSHKPVIEQYARHLNSFMEAMADGRIDESELEAQETRLVKLMKEIEPQLNDAVHEKVTRLLCELTAYDLMQMLNSMQAGRPQTEFQG